MKKYRLKPALITSLTTHKDHLISTPFQLSQTSGIHTIPPKSISTVQSPSSSSSPPLISLPPPLKLRRSLTTAASSSPNLPLFSEVVVNEAQSIGNDKSKTLIKGMRYSELEKWVQSHGFRPGQALMLWKRLYGNNIWAQCCDELEGLNKDLRNMLSEHA